MRKLLLLAGLLLIMATQRNLFQLANVAGFLDIPDSLIAAGSVINSLSLAGIQSNADFAACCFEMFYQELQDGDSVAKVQSAVDGYVYQSSELLYAHEIRTTVDPVSGLPAAPGGLLWANWHVNQTTGKLRIQESYYVQGGAQGNTNQGVQAVWIIGQRGRGVRTMASQPTFSDQSNSALLRDSPLTQSSIQAIGRNAKLGSVRIEAFILNGSGYPYWTAGATHSPGDNIQPTLGHADGCFYTCVIGGTSAGIEPTWPGDVKDTVLDGSVLWLAVGFGFVNGQTIGYPKSPVDQYQYSSADSFVCLPFFYITGAIEPGSGASTGPSILASRIQRMQKSATVGGAVSSSITYWNGSTQSVTNDGAIGVVAVCVRHTAAMAQTQNNYIESSGTEFGAGNVVGDTTIQNLNGNAKFGIVRKEEFTSTLAGGATVALPTSPTDGYSYTRNELLYPTFILDTGNQSGDNAIRDVLFYTDPELGTVHSRIDYFQGGNPYTTTNGSFLIACLGFRLSETLLQGVEIIPSAGSTIPAPAGSANLIPNGTFELWSGISPVNRQLVGLPDLWSVSAHTADGFTTQQPGMKGYYAVGLDVGNNHAPANQQYVAILDYPVAFVPGDPYFFSILARANPAISQGLKIRMHFRDINLANDTYIELISDSALGTGVTTISGNLSMPNQGYTSVRVQGVQNLSSGVRSIVGGPLGYAPAFVFVELWNYEPNVSSTIIYDECELEHLASSTIINNYATSAPAAPVVSQSAGGSLAARTYYLKTTYTQDGPAETDASPETSQAIAANNLATVQSPPQIASAQAYNVYAATSTGAEQLQTSTPIPLGTNWTEPTSGLVAGAAAPSSNTTGGIGLDATRDGSAYIRVQSVSSGHQTTTPSYQADSVSAVAQYTGTSPVNLVYNTSTQIASLSFTPAGGVVNIQITGQYDDQDTASVIVAVQGFRNGVQVTPNFVDTVPFRTAGEFKGINYTWWDLAPGNSPVTYSANVFLFINSTMAYVNTPQLTVVNLKV